MKGTEQHFKMLGQKAHDVVTGFSGVVTSLSFDLYGCVQVIITPSIDDKGIVQNGNWFDVGRVQLLSIEPVMPIPNFDSGYIAEGRKGASIKILPEKV